MKRISKKAFIKIWGQFHSDPRFPQFYKIRKEIDVNRIGSSAFETNPKKAYKQYLRERPRITKWLKEVYFRDNTLKGQMDRALGGIPMFGQNDKIKKIIRGK